MSVRKSSKGNKSPEYEREKKIMGVRRSITNSEGKDMENNF